MTTIKWLRTAYDHPDNGPSERWDKILMTREAGRATVVGLTPK